MVTSRGQGRLAEVGDGVRRYWPLIALTSALLLAGILGAAASYGDAQSAADVAEFQRIVTEGEVSDYTLAAVIDLFFAAGYGLLALATASGLSTMRGRGVKVAETGASLVFVAAMIDELENVAVLINVNTRDGVSEFAIDLMTTMGSFKWWAAVAGLALLLFGLLVRALWPTLKWSDVVTWVRTTGTPHVAFLGLVLLAVVLTLAHLRELAAVALAALVGVGIWLNRVLRSSRKTESEEGNRDLGPARLALTFIQLAAGVALFTWGVQEQPDPLTTKIVGSDTNVVVRDIFAVFGLVLSIVSLGSLVYELRQNRRFEHRRGQVLVLVAIALVAGGALVDAGILMLALFLAAVVIGEVATELAGADHRTTNDRSLIEQCLVLAAVEILAVLALVGVGADLLHAFRIALVLTLLICMALKDGDALFVAVAIGVLVVAVTRPYEIELEDSLRPEHNEPYILVLGDSYTSGEGAQDYLPRTNEIVPGPATETSVNECRQAPTAWGFEVARLAAENPIREDGDSLPTRVLFLACSGAVSENIDTEPRSGEDGKIHGPAQLLLYEQAIADGDLGPPSLVIVGIGGNDGGFGDLGQACVGPGNCAEVAEQFLRNRPERLIDPPDEGQSEALIDIGDDLDRAFENIQRVVGEDVPVVATSYPEPVATSERRCSSALLAANERVFINGFAEQLNEQVQAAAERADISFMNISGALAEGGSQLCSDSPTPGLNFFAFGSKGGTLRDSLNPKNWAHNSIHPSTAGHELFAKAAYVWLDENWPLESNVVDEIGAPSIDDLLDSLGVEQCRPQEDRSCSVEHGTWLTGQMTSQYRTTILPVGALVFALRLALLPLVARTSASREAVGLIEKKTR